MDGSQPRTTPRRIGHAKHTPPRQLQTLSAVDALAASLRQDILAGRLGAGEPIAEVQVVERYGVTRPTVRAALQLLVHNRLLVRQANRSAYVPRLTAGDVSDVFLVRRVLEIEAIERLCSRRVYPDRARRALRQLEALTASDPPEEVIELDLAVHCAVVEGVGSARLLNAYTEAVDETRLGIAQRGNVAYTPAALAADHRRVAEQVNLGMARDAVRVATAHLDASFRRMTEASSQTAMVEGAE